MPEVINESDEPDISGVFKTYYVQIDCDGHRYWKIGSTSKRIGQRFSKEARSTLITIRRIWRHKTEDRMLGHEAGLFRRHKGDLPFYGRMGPLLGGGNTEVYSHDVIGGEPGPIKFKVETFDSKGEHRAFDGYADFDPYSRWPVQYSWIAGLIGPEFDAYLVREKTDYRKLTVCSVDLLESIAEGRRSRNGISKGLAARTLEDGCWVHTYADTYREAGFVISRYSPKPRFSETPPIIYLPDRST